MQGTAQNEMNSPGFPSNTHRSDQQFFYHLRNYKPLFYSGRGAPVFMTNDNWHQSLLCLAVMDLLYIAALVMYITRMGKTQSTQYKGFQGLPGPAMLIVSILVLLFANLSVVLTQLLNPGIINPSSITDSQYIRNGGKKWCQACNAYSYQSMSHCRQCDVCIWGLDHHCGYFYKCIGGYQKFMFYAALTFGFMGFITVLILVASSIL